MLLLARDKILLMGVTQVLFSSFEFCADVAFDNLQGREAAKEGCGGGADGRTKMVISDKKRASRSGWGGTAQ